MALQLYLLQCKLLPSVVAAQGCPLVTAVPVGPGQDPPHPARRAGPVPQETPDLRQAQHPARPRSRLKAVKLCISGLFLGMRPGQNPQRKHHVPVPAGGTAHLVVVQPHFLLGHLEGVLDATVTTGPFPVSLPVPYRANSRMAILPEGKS